jgi:hypothetical protein
MCVYRTGIPGPSWDNHLERMNTRNESNQLNELSFITNLQNYFTYSQREVIAKGSRKHEAFEFVTVELQLLMP